MSSSQFSGAFGHVTKQLIIPGSHVTNQLTRRQNSQLSSTKEAKEADSHLKLSYVSNFTSSNLVLNRIYQGRNRIGIIFKEKMIKSSI